jgi:hypothetical protein
LNCPSSIRSRAILPAALILSIFAGRDESGGLVPAVGRVLYKGQPAVGARLHFHLQGAPTPGDRGPIPSGMVDDRGYFELATGDLGQGAPAGRYAVLVAWPEEASPVRPGPKGRSGFEPGSKLNKTPLDRLKGRYLDASAPRIFVELKRDSKELPPFDLTD